MRWSAEPICPVCGLPEDGSSYSEQCDGVWGHEDDWRQQDEDDYEAREDD